MQILLIEDNIPLAQGLQKALKNEDFVVNAVHNGKNALHVLQIEPPEMIILDLGLPDIDGIDLLKKIRQQHPTVPVLILTARDSISQKVEGLNQGADDYLTKPFEITELIARLHAFERRQSMTLNTKICIGPVCLDTTLHKVNVNEKSLELSRREYMLLKTLMEKAGKIQSKESLESKLYSWGEEVASNTIEVHIHHLRKKLGYDLIKTIRGVGYLIKNP